MPFDYSQYLRETPRAAFGAFMPQQRKFQRYFLPRYSDIYTGYEGELGRQAMAGQEPTMAFSDYLQSYPWLQQYYGTAPQQRGFYQSRFAPRTRWLMY